MKCVKECNVCEHKRYIEEAKEELDRRVGVLNNIELNAHPDYYEASMMEVSAQHKRINAIISDIKKVCSRYDK